MGNCLVPQGRKLIKISKADGGFLRYQSLSNVDRALSESPGRKTSDALPTVRRRDPTTGARRGRLCFLSPPKAPATKAEFGPGAVRIKLVVSKRELKEILRVGGVTLEGMISHLEREPSKGGETDCKERCMVWRPALESIPEGNDSY